MKKAIPVLILLLLFTLTACGGKSPEDVLKDYELVDVKTSKLQENDFARVYRVPKPVPDVAEELAKAQAPEQQSDVSEKRMILLYPDTVVDITTDPDKSGNSLVEVASKEYMAGNYSRDHFDLGDFAMGMVMAEVIDEMFDAWEHKYKPRTSGYSGGSGYSSSSGKSIRIGDTIRGGGSAVGK
ncbi:DUF4247 domain-containing protein [Desulfoscipio geothermicus]|uniref:DUF4247 domain-containing protein n=1 Tax=Desulfoscipio geothermicus DSM 3669 TaxID=1121426 RepID=A0A1I6DPV1_9FIRM|nr:DUF4247 domain-containing protein [Desulfoscipio geothermicus]SFR07411.1 protein of unknown function [Desulfoscipio geothermicus DSM 3669]